MTTPEPSTLPEEQPRKGKKGQKQYYGRTAKVGALWSVFRQGGNELLAIPTSMAMARLLSPHDFGVAAAASFFILLSTRVTQFGLAAALVRIKDFRPEHASSVFVANLSLGALTFAALFGGAPLIGAFFRSQETVDAVRIASLVFLVSPLGTVPAAIMHRNMQFRDKAVADWTDSLVGSVVSVILAFRGFGYWSIIWGQLVAVTIRVHLQMYLSRWKPSLRCSRSALRELLSYGIGVQAKRVLEYAAFHLDNVVVGRILGMSALGIYDKAFVTMNRLVTRLTLGQAPFRIFSIIHEDSERFQRAYSRLMLSVTLIGFPVLAACIVVAEPLFVVMYGRKWLPAVVPFQLLCAGGMLKLLNNYASQANEATGNLWPQVRWQAVGMVLVVIGAAIGSSRGGVPGAALGVLGALVVWTLSMQSLVRRATGLTWGQLARPQVPGIVCAALLALVLLGIEAVMTGIRPQAPEWQLLLVQGVGGAIFYAVFVLFAPIVMVRELVRETLNDMLPAGTVQALTWRRKAVPPA